MRKLKLKYYDNKVYLKENLNFFKNLIDSSKQGFIISILFIGSLIILDYTARNSTALFCSSNNNTLNTIADLIYRINESIGVKFLDYFKDIIVIVAGVLGVILGLFFTTFMNIVTSKYSNTNSEIISQLLKQKTINRYFKALAVLLSSAIIFQFLLILGYLPTFISAFIFTMVVILTLLAFIFFGRYSMIYFNADNIVFDLINSCDLILDRGYKNKEYFNADNNGQNILYPINRIINKIRIIVEESNNPQLKNTALDKISERLLSFAKRFNSFKHTFPSNKGWHLKTQKYKRWDEASSTEHGMYSKLGAMLPPETVDNFYHTEEQIIEIQYLIFNNIENINERIKLIYDQGQYLQIISFQCETKLFDKFFNQFESLINDCFIIGKENVVESNMQYVSVYANLMIQYLVGFNYNFDRLINKTQLKKLAKAIHYFENSDIIMQFPYKLRIWMDKYQEKLLNEKYDEGKILTPTFYTEYELAYQIQLIFKEHINDVAKRIYLRVRKFSEHLNKSNLFLEELEFLIESLDIYHKVNSFSDIVENKVINDIDALNLKKEKNFEFKEREELLKLNESFKNILIRDIWELGYSSYTLKSDDIPDIYGNFYQLICDDILDKIFADDISIIIDYLPKFYTYNLIYIESLRQKIDLKRYEYTTSKIFPISVDLFEISALVIILFKIYGNEKLQETFFDFWNKAFEKDESKEKGFWGLNISIYEYFNQAIFILSTPSHIKEHKRKRKLETFLKNSKFVRLEKTESRYFTVDSHYVTDVDDLFIKEIVSSLSDDGIGGLYSDELSDLFIEYFLRTRISLKDLKIKETRYGSEIRTNLERDSK